MTPQEKADQRISDLIHTSAEAAYSKLRRLNLDAYKEVMASASVLQLTFSLDAKTTAAVERALVFATLRGLEAPRVDNT